MKYIIVKFVAQFLSFFGRFVPRTNLIIVGGMEGKYFGDNSRYIYDYLLKTERTGAKIVWLTKSEEVVKELKQRQLPVCKINSFLGIYLLFRAKVGLFTNSLRDLAITPFLVPSNLNLIALRHGRSVKRVRFARKYHKLSKEEASERRCEAKLIKYVISTSDFISQIQEECLKLGLMKNVVTGYPRNDIFYDGGRVSIIKDKNFSILYAPSWRHGRKPTSFFPFKDFDEKELFAFLRENKISLYLRPHKNDFHKYPQLNEFLQRIVKGSEKIHMATHDLFPDVNEILPDFDALITDYSALYHDYLLLDRPILFIPYDFSDFNLQNGFLYDYKRYLPGSSIETKRDFYNELKKLIEGEDLYKEKREFMRNKIHDYQDGESSKRVFKLVINTLHEE
jgi:CDP-glycerol glycerophosphotransferase (TagB/SpsB family)